MGNSRKYTFFLIVLQSIIILIAILFLALVPKALLYKSKKFEITNSMAIIAESNFVFYSYKVYSTETRFEEKLDGDIKETVEVFKKKNDILAVYIKGDNASSENKGEYMLFYSPDIPELNVEYYIIKNIKMADFSIPAKTFLLMYDDISKVANAIYWLVLLLIIIPVLFTTALKLFKNVEKIKLGTQVAEDTIKKAKEQPPQSS